MILESSEAHLGYSFYLLQAFGPGVVRRVVEDHPGAFQVSYGLGLWVQHPIKAFSNLVFILCVAIVKNNYQYISHK